MISYLYFFINLKVSVISEVDGLTLLRWELEKLKRETFRRRRKLIHLAVSLGFSR